MKGGIFVLGLLILIISFGFNNYYSSQDIAQLQLANSACNSGVGTFAKALSQDAANKCEEINALNTIHNLLPLG